MPSARKAVMQMNEKQRKAAIIVASILGCGALFYLGGLLGHAPIMPISRYSPAVMIHRGGRIPAPMQALKN